MQKEKNIPFFKEYMEFYKKCGFFNDAENKKEIVDLLLIMANMYEL